MKKLWCPTLLAVMFSMVPSVASAGGGGGGNKKGKVSFPLELGIVAGEEIAIREPSMCDGDASVKVKWNKNKNKVKVKAKFNGLPYQQDLCFDQDPSTPYNEYPLCVEDGKWQMWVVSRFFTRTSTWYYDSVSGDLIANEFDLPAGPPPGSIPVLLPALQMACSPFFESNPANLKENFQFELKYDELLDVLGSPGTILTILPFNIFDEDSFWVYYTAAILPMEEAQSWDDTLADIDAGVGGFAISTSLEPDPKPPELLTHDQLMIGWSQAYPPGLLTPLPPEVFDDPVCGTEQVFLPFPGGQLPV